MSKPTANLTFWGVRGSTPTVDRVNRRYGGNTPCLELTTPAGAKIILDCGTGLRMLGNRWTAELSPARTDADIFVTHYHWDHIQGIPFFAPFYNPANRFRLYGFRSEFLGQDSLRRIFETQMSGPYFPATLDAVPAAREFHEIEGGASIQVRDTRVITRWLNHPQGCLGLRFETPAGIIAYATDNEPGNAEHEANLRELADGADIFINDAQYAPGEMGAHRGWGHSSWLDGVRMAERACARHLILFHHDPDSSDETIDDLWREARLRFPNSWAASEGMSVTLSPDKTEIHTPAGAEAPEPEPAPARR